MEWSILALWMARIIEGPSEPNANISLTHLLSPTMEQIIPSTPLLEQRFLSLHVVAITCGL
jgi:hypothetical protein